MSALVASAVTAAALAAPTPELKSMQQFIASKVQLVAVKAGFGIDQVSVTGQRYTLDGDVFDALDLDNVRTFWDLDARAALHRVERISWVDQAQITRVYPSRLNIEISERQPSAIWQRASKSYLIDRSGRVLGALGRTHHWRLPVVAGEGANNDFSTLMTALDRHAALRQNLLRAERVSERRWRIVFKNQSAIELAADREAEGLDRVIGNTQLRQALLSAGMIVDVRTPGRITVRPRPTTPQAQG